MMVDNHMAFTDGIICFCRECCFLRVAQMYRLILHYLALAVAAASLWGCNRPAGKSLEAFVGSATKPATEEATEAFEQATGIKVRLNFGGSGGMLSQMKLSHRGDIYFPGSSDFMEKAIAEDLVFPDTVRRVVHLVPAINVARGNPQGIEELGDLARSGLRVAIARPETVCVGRYAVEILEHNDQSDAVRSNIITFTQSCSATAGIIAMNKADAVLGWRVFQYWAPDKIEAVFLRPEEVPRIAYVPIAISRFTTDRVTAQRFIDFMVSEEAKAIFRRWNYLVTEDEAREFAPDSTIGGEYELPAGW